MATDPNLIGGAWLAQQYELPLVAPLAVVSSIGGRRSTRSEPFRRYEEHQEAMRPAATLRGHLAFHLKHEVVHLELLARLFAACDKDELTEWVHAEPTGQYARRAGFLYEWLTGAKLNVQDAQAGNYFEAIDSDQLLTAQGEKAELNKRWRIRDNMPGTPEFCPTVRLEHAGPAFQLDVSGLLEQLRQQFGEDLLMKSATWMTFRESKSSFAIEGEADQASRVQRFAAVLGSRTGQGEPPLDDAQLAQMQKEILGSDTTLKHFGIRVSPVFVGETVRFQEVVHYIAPPAAAVPGMLEGIATFLKRTTGCSSVARSAVAAFGFVYVHPLADGNGRVHRFLVNDVLRRDGVAQEPLIIPVSAFITSERAQRKRYDAALDEISRPLMRMLAGHYRFAGQVEHTDGIRSNLELSEEGNRLANPAWRFPDLTSHTLYLADVLQRTICEDMLKEAQYMRGHERAREAIKEILEMPNHQIDRLIRSAETNQGKLSGALAAEIPELQLPGRWEAIVEALHESFADAPTPEEIQAYKPQRLAG